MKHTGTQKGRNTLHTDLSSRKPEIYHYCIWPHPLTFHLPDQNTTNWTEPSLTFRKNPLVEFPPSSEQLPVKWGDLRAQCQITIKGTDVWVDMWHHAVTHVCLHRAWTAVFTHDVCEVRSMELTQSQTPWIQTGLVAPGLLLKKKKKKKSGWNVDALSNESTSPL